MSQFGAKAADFTNAGTTLFGVSSDTPFAHDAWAAQLGLPYGLLSDYNWEAAKAFGLYFENGADLAEGVANFSPINTRGAFLIDTDATVKYAWTAPEIGQLPDPQPLLEAAQAL